MVTKFANFERAMCESTREIRRCRGWLRSNSRWFLEFLVWQNWGMKRGLRLFRSASPRPVCGAIAKERNVAFCPRHHTSKARGPKLVQQELFLRIAGDGSSAWYSGCTLVAKVGAEYGRPSLADFLRPDVESVLMAHRRATGQFDRVLPTAFRTARRGATRPGGAFHAC